MEKKNVIWRNMNKNLTYLLKVIYLQFQESPKISKNWNDTKHVLWSYELILKEINNAEYQEESQGLDEVAHTCNPSFSRGTDGEDQSSRPAQAKGY
jgi:hypothetical protein